MDQEGGQEGSPICNLAPWFFSALNPLLAFTLKSKSSHRMADTSPPQPAGSISAPAPERTSMRCHRSTAASLATAFPHHRFLTTPAGLRPCQLCLGRQEGQVGCSLSSRGTSSSPPFQVAWADLDSCLLHRSKPVPSAQEGTLY